MKKFVFSLFFFLNLTLNTEAEITYIDINFILNESEVGKNLNNYIEGIQKSHISEYKAIEQELINKEKSLISQQNILSKEEFQIKLDSLTMEVQHYRSNKKSSKDKLNDIKIKHTKEILKELNPIITNYVELNSISIVIPKKNIVVGKKNLDITNQIIKILNDKINKLNF